MSPALAGRFFTTSTTCDFLKMLYYTSKHTHTHICQNIFIYFLKISHTCYYNACICRDPSSLGMELSSVQSLSRVWFYMTPCAAACQAPLSITNSQSLFQPLSIESVMPSNHLILCCPLLLPPSIFPSIRVFSSESVLCITWPKY